MNNKIIKAELHYDSSIIDGVLGVCVFENKTKALAYFPSFKGAKFDISFISILNKYNDKYISKSEPNTFINFPNSLYISSFDGNIKMKENVIKVFNLKEDIDKIKNIYETLNVFT